MMSILKSVWKRIAGPGGSAQPDEPPAEAVEYKGYRIRPTPFSARGGFQTSGVIEKDFPDGAKAHPFIRAETHPSGEDAAAFAISKGRQIIDEQGDRLFEPVARRGAPE